MEDLTSQAYMITDKEGSDIPTPRKSDSISSGGYPQPKIVPSGNGKTYDLRKSVD